MPAKEDEMANKNIATPAGVREASVFDSASPTADNDVEPVELREVTAELSLRARVAPQAAAGKPRRAVAG